MHIRKLELQGFKSFPDRTSFHFASGLSGVVGPNGCGKSNVVDAVKWCLGEQSAKQLRGQAMEDVIFGGSQLRTPVGLAEVAITFAAGDEPFPGEFARYEEIQISRRLYRDGNSEYYINQERVRLKDIQDLFLDTGVGNKMYSFIEQGRISKIVDAKPIDRRSLIEEAAGISRYNARREEAQSKLETTEQNLERAAEVTEELATRLRALARQVEKANLYRRLKSEMRQGEIFLGLARYAGLAGDRKALAERLGVARNDEEARVREVATSEAEIASARQELEVLETGFQRSKDDQSELEATRREKESARQYQGREAEALEKRIVELTAQGGLAAEELAAAEARFATVSQERVAVEATLADADGVVLEARRRTSSAVDEQAAVRKAVEDGKATVMRCVTEHARIEAAQAAAERQKGQLAERAAAVELRSAEAGESLQHLETALEIARTRHAATQAALAAARESLDAAKQKVQETKERSRGLAVDLKAAERARDEVGRAEADARARVDAHRQMLVDHAGVPDGLRDALSVDGTLGTLAENLEVPIEIEEPVAALLGELAQAVLVPDEAVAALVRARASGRVSVIVVDGMDVPSTGFLARIQGTEWGRRALRQVFGVLPEATDVGAAILRAREQELPVRSACGAFADQNGVVRWGKPGGEGASLLGRRRELAAFETALVEASARRAGGESRVSAAEEALRAIAAEVEAVEAALDASRTAMNDKELAERDGAHGVTTRARELEARQARAGEIERERTDVRAKTVALEAELADLQTRGAATLVEQDAAEAGLRVHQSQLFTTEERTQRERAELTRLETELGGLRRRVGELVDAESTTRASCDGARARMTAAMEESQVARERVDYLRQDDQRLASLLEELTTTQSELRERIEIERVRLKSERDRLGGIEKRLKDLWQLREQATALRTQLESRLEEAKAEIQRIREGLEERYQLSVASLLDRVEQAGHVIVEADRQNDVAVRDADTPAEVDGSLEGVAMASDLTITAAMLEDAEVLGEWTERVKTARAKLDRLGDVNLVAVHEYKEVAERFETLDAQRIDLEGSVRTIRDTIAKLNKTCRERFRETFDRVNAIFEEVYPRLVGGGQARLVLTNEDDLLETGVDIFVQPPGKRMQNLSLLSGGEMAMTSIALIFALFRVKPSPFCLLDEVDAPLDEGNGARFNSMLKEMASLSQFIVVTHNKKTMECMDTLYGVTMNNPGISSVVSVQME